MNPVLDKFDELGRSASFHYADDSGKEWDLARKDKEAAEALFIAHPELRDEMIAIARNFLWSLDVKRLLNQ